MKLLIISNMSHYIKNGSLVGWGPTVEEINHLADLFVEIRHLGCLHETDAPDSSLPYTKENISFVPLPPAGGNSLKDKLTIVKYLPLYLKKIWVELNAAEVVHLRCPANIPLLGLLILLLRKKPVFRWAKYAGNWGAGKEYPFFYRFQRWLLSSNLCNCVVTVNGSWPEQKPFIHSFLNPCITANELRYAQIVTETKQLSIPVNLIFVGALNESKGIGRLLQIAHTLKHQGVSFHLEILGDGPNKENYHKFVIENGMQSEITFRGWVPRNKLGEYYAASHIQVFPSASEGWPKALSEGMAYGVVPIAGAVASIPQILDATRAGIAVRPLVIEDYVNNIVNFVDSPDLWRNYSINATIAAGKFSYSSYLNAVKDLFKSHWHIDLGQRTE